MARSLRLIRARTFVAAFASALVLGQIALSGFARIIPVSVQERICDPTYVHQSRTLKARLADPDAPNPFSIVFFGSSRTEYIADGALVEKIVGERSSQRPVVAYSMGQVAAGPVMHAACLDRLLRDGCRPSVIVFELHPCFVAEKLPFNGEPLFLRQRFTDGELSTLERDGAFEGKPIEIRGNWWYGHRRELVEFGRRLFGPSGDAGDAWRPTAGVRDRWGTIVRAPESENPDAEYRAKYVAQANHQYGVCLKTLRIGGATWRYFQRNLDRCAAEGIHAIVVRSPEGPTLRGWYGPGVAEGIDAKLKELRQRRGVTVVDAWKWLEEDDFWDSHHANSRGARRFCERLAIEAIVPLASGANAPGDFLLTTRSKIE